MRHLFFVALTFFALGLLDSCSKNGSTPNLTGSALTHAVKINNSDLPQAAQDYIAAHYPNATIKEVEKGTDEQNGAQEYGVLLSDGTALLFDLNGNFLRLDDNHQDGGGDSNNEHSDSTDVDNDNVQEGDSTDVDHDGEHNSGNLTLPAPAQTWLDANFPGALVHHTDLDTLCDGTVLISVTIKQGQTETGLAFTPAGTFLFKETELPFANLPPVVGNAVGVQFPNGNPDQDAKQLEYADGSLRYEIQVKYNNDDWAAFFKADGALICQEKDGE